MISEHILLALLKQSDTRTNADIEQIASFCRLFSVFNEIPEHTFNAFCKIIEIDEFDPGAIIYKEGDVGSDWYIIVEGSVNVTSNMNSTSPIRGMMKIGDSFGRNALQQDVVRGETIVCVDHVYVLRVGRKQYQEMIQNAVSGLDGETQAFANTFLQGLCPLPGMHIATSVSRKVFPSNTVVMKQGEEPEGIYYILRGSAAVVREVPFPSKKEPVSRLVEIDELFTGATFGIRSLCLNTVENVSVIAKCELITLFLSRSDFYRKVDIQKQRKVLPPDYPDDATIRKLFKQQTQWEEYKKKVVREVLAHKKARRELKLQY
ncbi:cyclic nucleotide-binding domain containing protein [Tritrichomonas foetus]|uniref:Cyclic nucleotide-binding domain containing protein n=1 Tax=Tritrichomonas foetus TaxID=1144522 RepID=A0A1J4L2D9_9EUKA|nr:cyclic nucleotide-binding domain containing protein [Tritrichomonas foetus]|eukprot:OHT16102.1 cyclic nucleotide-binding domain containing protein [Tritrichomonas foetus]